MSSKHPAALTDREFAELLNGTMTKVTFNRATLEVAAMPIIGAEQETERRFVMQGPSGKHTLLVDATDCARLNAHWTIFATDSRNAPAA